MMRRSGFLFLVCLVSILMAIAAFCGRGIVHVRPGSFAAAGQRVLPPGWHLTSPFHRAELLADEGDGALPPLPVSSREGVRGTAKLSFHFRADVAALSRAASKQALGFHSLMERAASEALQQTLAGRSALDFLDRAALESPLTTAVIRSLESVGMRVSDLKWEIRLPETKTGTKIPISAGYRKVLAVWNILSEFGRSSAVVGWWASYPADRVKGFLISDRVAALSMLPGREKLADRPGYTFPASYLKEILPKLSRPGEASLEEVRRFADVSPAEYEAGLEWVAHPPAPPKEKKEKPPVQDPVGLLIKILTAARNYQTIALDLLGRGPFDLAAVYFEGIDLVGHRFQHYRPPRMRTISESEYRKFGRTVTEYYRYQDHMI